MTQTEMNDFDHDSELPLIRDHVLFEVTKIYLKMDYHLEYLHDNNLEILKLITKYFVKL